MADDTFQGVLCDDGRYRCFYCGDPVLPHHMEKDHFPVPASCGGAQTVPACWQCHDLKDRTSWATLPLDMRAAFLEEFEGMGRAAKIVFAQFMRAAFESTNRTDQRLEVGDLLQTADSKWIVTEVKPSKDGTSFDIRPYEKLPATP